MGSNVRNVAESARKAGFDVFAITRYDDSDLRIYADVMRVEEFDRDVVDGVAESLGAPVVLCSGCECLRVRSDVMGTDPRVSELVTDKLRFYKTLERAGIPFPELTDEPPMIAKPRRGGGGVGVRVVSSVDDVPRGYICQRYVKGTPCSVSLICGEGYAVPISVNEVLVGLREMNATGFVYCGNVTPLSVEGSKIREIVNTALETVELFDLLGSVGVDFILSEKPYVLEINPRFQGSLDSVEWSTDLNVFSLHYKACNGGRVEGVRPKRYACRAVMFAERRMLIRRDLKGNGMFADVPKAGEVIEKGSPVVSILSSGRSREEVLGKVGLYKELFLELAL